MFDTPAYKEFFDPSLGHGKGERKWFEWKRIVNDQAMLDRTFSKSYVAYRSDEEKQKIKEDMTRMLRDWKGHEWVDEEVCHPSLVSSLLADRDATGWHLSTYIQDSRRHHGAQVERLYLDITNPEIIVYR